jgi:hypothetical protein
MSKKRGDDLRGKTPESWSCVDCGINTAPGHPNRIEMEKLYRRSAALSRAGIETPVAKVTYNDRCEIYTVRDAVWKKAGMDPMGGRLCVGCLEKRLGRSLRPKDFPRRDEFNILPGTKRLIERRGTPGVRPWSAVTPTTRASWAGLGAPTNRNIS